VRECISIPELQNCRIGDFEHTFEFAILVTHLIYWTYRPSAIPQFTREELYRMRAIILDKPNKDVTTARLTWPAHAALQQLQAFFTHKYGRYFTAADAVLEAHRIIREKDEQERQS
jgi:hypothetical protein